MFTNDLNSITKSSAKHGLVLNPNKSVAIICDVKKQVNTIKVFNHTIEISETLIPFQNCVRNLGLPIA